MNLFQWWPDLGSQVGCSLHFLEWDMDGQRQTYSSRPYCCSTSLREWAVGATRIGLGQRRPVDPSNRNGVRLQKVWIRPEADWSQMSTFPSLLIGSHFSYPPLSPAFTPPSAPSTLLLLLHLLLLQLPPHKCLQGKLLSTEAAREGRDWTDGGSQGRIRQMEAAREGLDK